MRPRTAAGELAEKRLFLGDDSLTLTVADAQKGNARRKQQISTAKAWIAARLRVLLCLPTAPMLPIELTATPVRRRFLGSFSTINVRLRTNGTPHRCKAQ